MYKDIPSSGSGSSGTNYDETDYGYDLLDRTNRVVTPGGTITRTVFDPRSLPLSVWVGTNDTGATVSNPAGSGAPNNMQQITGNEYDGGSAGGDGNLTEQTAFVDGSTSRVTSFLYDWRDRRTATDGEIDFYQKTYYDNLDRVFKVERYDTTSGGNLIAKSETLYDDLDRVYQTIVYGVDPGTGTVGNALTSNTWYGQAGNVIKELPAGSHMAVKRTYDALNRLTATFLGYNYSDTSYSTAGSVTGDTLFQQTEYTYDAASNQIALTQRLRYHNATGTGELTTPGGSQPKARVLYSAAWPDPVGRTINSANYGTNLGSALSRPSTAPSRSDTVLVTTQAFDGRGDLTGVTDPADTITRFSYDDRGRELGRVLNWSAESPPESWEELTCDDWGAMTCDDWGTLECNVSDDTNIALNTTYTADGQVATVTAVNSATGNQTTTYTYGTTLSDSDIASNLLLRQVTYPDSVSDSDIVQYAYNRQGQVKAFADQNGTVHSYNFDLLGRRTQDRVTSVGTGIDNAVLRIETTYGLRGLPLHITSYDNAAVGSGSVVNDLQRSYNDFVQLETEYQEHGGAVNTTTSLKVQYAYANGSANTIRPTQMTYPDGRELNFNYGSGSSTPDALSRIAAFIDDDGTTHLADYSYLGPEGIIRVENPEPGMEYTLIGDHGGADDPDTGDIYWGLDLFGRVKDLCWYIPGTPVTYLERVQHGYDRAGNRLWRKNPVAEAASAQFDELYKYDGVYRLGSFQRGTLNTDETGLDSQTFDECWTLDATGNWRSFRQDDTGDGAWDLVQARTASKVNAITGLTNSTGPVWTTPEYDAAGNMTTMPQPADPTEAFIATYDAWNRLVKLTDGTDIIATYAYDGLGRRIVKNSDFTGSTPDVVRHVYYTSAWQAIEERIDPATAMDRQFVWGLRYIDDLILRDRQLMSVERLYAVQDPNWNVTAIVNESGDIEERYAYDAYGSPAFFTPLFIPISTSFEWETLFAGYQSEQVTELYGVRHRDYCSRIGSWMKRDPIGYRGGLSLYEYNMGKPILLTDPLGLDGFMRFLGGLQCVGGVFESVGGLAMAGAGALSEGGTLGLSSPASVPAMAGGAYLFLNGYDNAVAGWKTLWNTGTPTQTVTSKLVQSATSPIVGERWGFGIGEAVNAGSSFVSGGLGSGSVMLRNTGSVDDVATVYRGMSSAQYKELMSTLDTATNTVQLPLNGKASLWSRLRHSFISGESGYQSTSLNPCTARGFGEGGGYGGCVVPLLVPKSNLCLPITRFREAEFLIKGGSRVTLGGKVPLRPPAGIFLPQQMPAITAAGTAGTLVNDVTIWARGDGRPE